VYVVGKRTPLYAGISGILIPLGATVPHPLQRKSTPNMGLTQPPIKWVLGDLSLGVKWLGHEADHSLPPSAKDKSKWTYIPIPLKCLHVVHRNNLSLPILY